jgi:hypothetical protein
MSRGFSLRESLKFSTTKAPQTNVAKSASDWNVERHLKEMLSDRATLLFYVWTSGRLSALPFGLSPYPQHFSLRALPPPIFATFEEELYVLEISDS